MRHVACGKVSFGLKAYKRLSQSVAFNRSATWVHTPGRRIRGMYVIHSRGHSRVQGACGRVAFINCGNCNRIREIWPEIATGFCFVVFLCATVYNFAAIYLMHFCDRVIWQMNCVLNE